MLKYIGNIGRIFYFICILFGTSTAYAVDRLDGQVLSDINYLMNNVSSNYSKAVIQRAAEIRFSGMALHHTSLALSALESAQVNRLTASTDGTPLQLELYSIIDSLNDLKAKQILRARFAAKPAGLTSKLTSAHFDVWYTTAAASPNKTTLAFATKVSNYLEKAYAQEVTTMGYKAGASNGAVKYQTYIAKLSATPGTIMYGVTGSFTVNPVGSNTVARTFTQIGVNNSMPDDSQTLDTCAHEYFHSIELSYMAFTGFVGAQHLWMLEASTTWIANYVRSLNPTIAGATSWNVTKSRFDYKQGTPERSLDKVGLTITDDYDAGLFMWFLTQNKKIPGTVALHKKFWAKMGFLNNWSKPYTALDSAVAGLAAKYNTLKKIFPYFAGANYAATEWYSKIIKTVKIVNNAAPHVLDYSTPTSHRTGLQNVVVNHLAAKYYKVKPGTSLTKPRVLTVRIYGDPLKAGGYVVAKKKDGSYVDYPVVIDRGVAPNMYGEVGVSGFSNGNMAEVVIIPVNTTDAVTPTNALPMKYEAFLSKGMAFVIDDTGSMGGEIAAAKTAVNNILTLNKAARLAGGQTYHYTLLSFKDGPATVRGQASDEDVMIGMVNTLFASGGWRCPESSLTAIRQAAKLSEGSDIFMMTDASSNSFGVDGTFATAGEVFLTALKLLSTNSILHTIIYSDCTGLPSLASDGAAQAALYNNLVSQCPTGQCMYTQPGGSLMAAVPRMPGVGGYQLLSSETGGLYFPITTLQTTAALEVILRASSADSTVAFHNGTLGVGGLPQVYTIPADASITQLQLGVNGGVGSAVTVVVKNPAGVIVNNLTAGVSVVNVGGSSFYLIDPPALATGNWTVTVSGTGAYTASSKASTTNPMEYTGDVSVATGGTLSMVVDLRSAVASLTFQLVSKDGVAAPIPVTMTADATGLHFTGTQIMATAGGYRLQASGNGFFQRMESTPINVGNVDVVAPALKNVTPGTNLNHTFTVSNLGAITETYDVFSSSSLGWSTLTGVPATITLAAGASQNIVIPVAVPTTALSGQRDILSIQVSSQTTVGANDAAETSTLVGAIYDLNGDGRVDVVDIMLVVARWNSVMGDANYDVNFDLDANGRIDIIDIMRVAAQWGFVA